jgi:hypothetical protein
MNNTRHRLPLLNVELSGICNLSCTSCTFQSVKRTPVMTDETLDRVFEEIRTVDVEEIPWFSGGEIATIPNSRLSEICNRINWERIGSSAKWLSEVHTNCTLMDEEKADIWVNSGAFDEIRISADGPNKEFWEENRIRHNKTPFPWEKLLDNLEILLKANSKRKNPIKIKFWCLFPQNRKNPGPDPNFIKLLNKYPNANDGYNGSVGLHGWIYGRPPGAPIPDGKCPWHYRQVVILSNGKYTTCCRDLNGVNVYGDIKDMSLIEAINLPFDTKYTKIGCRTCVG